MRGTETFRWLGYPVFIELRCTAIRWRNPPEQGTLVQGPPHSIRQYNSGHASKTSPRPAIGAPHKRAPPFFHNLLRYGLSL